MTLGHPRLGRGDALNAKEPNTAIKINFVVLGTAKVIKRGGFI